ncbi:P-loop containing nucleoside triphosphate hydrolase protein [Coniochaeta sp. PMI_546]|nr:P-loop containing nucleoside triphosphate hydrolase protein [Coniochaeta sp. PMI_546]
MEFSGCLNDADLGPAVQGCRDDFDFTLRFEKIFLATLPAAIFIALSIPRIVFLVRRPKIAGGPVWQAVKQITLGVYAVLQLVLLVLSCTRAARLTDVFVASAALNLVASFCMSWMSFLEHSRSPRPSILLNAFLFLTTLFDVAQARSLWMSAATSSEKSYTGILTASIVVKAVAVVLESMRKERWLEWDRKIHSPEETAGLYGLGVFSWLNSLFLRGYKKVLELSDLFPLDRHMASETLEAALQSRIDAGNFHGQKNALAKALFKTLAVPFLLPVGPRVALMGFQFCQPFLIETLLDYLQEPDSENAANIGKGLIGASVLVYLGIAVSTAFYWYYQERALFMARGCLAAAVYKKTTKARLDAADDSAAVTLMSTDVERIRVGFLTLHEFWSNTIQVAVACYLLYKQIGAAFASSIVIVGVCVVISSLLARITGPRQKAWMSKIQKRVGLTANVIANMKHLKISGLTGPVEEAIQDMRMDELKTGSRFRMVQVWAATLAYVPLWFAPVFTFAITSHQLDVTTIFTSISYLTLLANPLAYLFQSLPGLLSAFACLNRIQAFLDKESRDDFRETIEPTVAEKQPGGTGSEKTTPAIRIERGSFGWSDGIFNLKDVTATIPSSSLTIVVGPIASGKSTLCKALLGETPLSQGKVIMASNYRKIGYCDQTPFLTNSTLRSNIVGFSAYDETRYREVIEATQLTRDLLLFPQGDRTKVGSNGITLSGGQKQRVSIARALYAESDLLIFDDILSGLDADTEELVFNRVFGPTGILKQRGATVVLCTHSIRHLPSADHIIALGSEGTLVEEGKFDDLVANKKYVHSLGVKSSRASGSGQSSGRATPTEMDDETTHHLFRSKTIEAKKSPLDLTRQLGDTTVYRYYYGSIGPFWAFLFLGCGVVSGFFYNWPTIWLKFWSEDVTKPNPTHSSGFYVGLYAVFQILCMLFFLAVLVIALKTLIEISGAFLHKMALRTVIAAPLRFFTTTDSGIVTNLFSQDITIIDGELPMSLINLCLDVFIAIGMAAIVATSSPYIVVCYPFMVGTLFGIQKFYLRTSRQLRLLDLEAKSPLYTHFIDTIKGVATFRAFGWTEASIDENNKYLETSQRPAYLLAMIQRWLLFVLNVVVAVIAVVVVTLAIQLRANQGFTGASLVTIMGFGDILANIVRCYTMLETSIGAVSRLKTFSDTTAPEDLPGEDVVPPESWPPRGLIEIRNMSASYGDPQSTTPEEDEKDSRPGSLGALALRNLNLTIQPGEKVAICGRSGSGKSSTILLLLRLLDPVAQSPPGSSSSSIAIDSLPLDRVERSALRRRVIAVPQEAVFLPDGTSFRTNLDPYGAGSEADCRAVLEAVELWGFVEERGGLGAGMVGDSLSQGQKQLFSLARAMLRRRIRGGALAASEGGGGGDGEKEKEGEGGGGGVLLLDEVSSSVDVDTDRAMQGIIKREFEGYTIVMVSHRLDMVMDFDRVLVMDAGSVVEEGRPRELVGTEGSRFRDLWLVGGRG